MNTTQMLTRLFPKTKNISEVVEILEKYKNEYAMRNKINLLRISYSEIKNINWRLTNEFKKHNK